MSRPLASRHRRALLEALGRDVALIPAGSERVRSRDTTHPFRPDSDFWYLTAFPEPDAVALLVPGHEPGPFVLFVNPKDPLKETWHGRRAGVEGARDVYGADEAFPIEEFDQRLPQLLKGAPALHYATAIDPDLDRRVFSSLRALNARVRDGVPGPDAIIDPSRLLHEQRLIKSEEELELLRCAASITDEAHRKSMAALCPGLPEYEIEALVDGIFRRRGGSGPGYTTICAGGSNACVLHYTTNDMNLGAGELLLLDAGCEYAGYTADVTRTFPVSGSYEGPQRELYQLVLDAQTAALDGVAPGRRFDDVHQAALHKLVEGLIALEFLPGGLDENLEGKTYDRWYMHRTSHWLGLDVHDVGRYHEPDGSSRILKPGMVLTVEPGLYIAPDDESAPERFRGLGVRIEDDVAVTEHGHENLTAAIPKTIDDVEAVC